MAYLTPYHREKTERCLQKMKEWRKSQMTLEEQLAAAQTMKDNMAKGIAMQSQH